MSTKADNVAKDALALSVSDRVHLVDCILASLYLPSNPEITLLWQNEAEKRVAEIESGEVEPVAGEDVLAEIRRKYSK